MKVSEMIPSKWLKADDFDDDVLATIDHISNEEVGNEGDRRWVLYFREMTKGLCLNVTNTRELEGTFGDETDDWIGKKVTIYSAPVQYQGKTVKGVRLRANKKAAQGGDEDESL